MNLHEYQAKQLLAEYDLPIPFGIVCHSQHDIEAALQKLGNAPWVMKCQVHAGGRGKAGGVQLIHSLHDAQTFAEKWFEKRLVTQQTTQEGQPVNAILIEYATDIAKEFYLSAIVDRASHRIVFMASTEGGVDIEHIAAQAPEKLFRVEIDPLTGAQPFQARELAGKLGFTHSQTQQFTPIFLQLAALFVKCDLNLLEINPFVLTQSGGFVCLDAKISLDSNALFRQPALKSLYDATQDDPAEVRAAEVGLSYVSLDGNIGCLVNGAGLAMATMDMVKLSGGSPANFLDVGGGATKERVAQAFKMILSDKKVDAIFVNIFGGIVRCDLIADGIIQAIEDVGIHVPVVVRLEGNQAQLGATKLANSQLNIISESNLQLASDYVVAAARRSA